jgi:hypothetical protein
MSRIIALVSRTKSKQVYNNIKDIEVRMNATGSTGQSGDTGNTGFTGGTIVGQYGRYGLRGASGEKGMTGKIADRGDNGPTGITGQQGINGQQPDFIGPTGYQGDTGFTGNKGSTGYHGYFGNTGITGVSGSTGNDGSTGFTGEDGFTGDSGVTGITGAFGENGEVGYTGPTGFSGISGATGATGATGIVGIAGADGFTGENGENGLIGVIGFTGSTGEEGDKGADGPIGTTGLIGFTGEVGFTGLDGTSTSGPTGVSGSIGDSIIGDIGMTGPRGITGPTGNLYASQITNLQTLTSKLYKTNDTLVIEGDFVDIGTFITITPKNIGNKTLNYPVPSNGMLFGTSNLGANMMCSKDGRYVSLCASGCVHVSKDYGKTFSIITFDSVIYAIAVSATGKYQCCVSTGVPKACINVSNDFGVTWTETLVSGSAYDKWLSSVSISPSGKYIYCSGGGGSSMLNWSSNNYGVSFSAGGSIQIKTTSSVNDVGKVISITSAGRYFITDLSSAISELTRGVLSTTIGQYFVSMNQEAPGYVSVGPAGFVYNPLPAGSVTALTTRTTPEVFQQAQIIIGNKVWARSSNTIYTSIDLGISWSRIYTSITPIKTMYITSESSFLYILLITGDLIRTTIYLPQTKIIGSKTIISDPLNFSLLTYGSIGRTVFLSVPLGKWLITYGFKMGIDNATGNCINSNIRHGIGGLNIGEEFIYSSNYSTYGITFGDPSTYQVFSNNFIMSFSSVSQLEVEIVLLNSPVNGPTSVFVYDIFLERKFISM